MLSRPWDPVIIERPTIVYAEPPMSAPQAVPPAPAPAPQPLPEPVIYPNLGQSATQTEADRQACNRWATTQPAAMADASVFHRATIACIPARWPARAADAVRGLHGPGAARGAGPPGRRGHRRPAGPGHPGRGRGGGRRGRSDRRAGAHMVDPLPRLLRAVLPAWRARGGGCFLVMGSASALRGIKRTSSYAAARGAQLAWVQAAGAELGASGVQVNAIAQNFVDNPTYFPASLQALPAFQARLAREVPLGRLVTGEEDAAFAAYLLSDAAACFVGQVFPLSGGWAVR
ncbi:SDR family oxidoreductase [Piscinibacter sakaiensis]|uniref:SDR family oxidoreductase n=1 Tax=Piscinibacter sakaiensis TaxID=1547922 RepID=UPI003727F9E2